MKKLLYTLFALLLLTPLATLTSQTNQVLVLDGIGDYVDLPETSSMTTFSDKITMEALIKINNYTTSNDCSVLNTGNQTDYSLNITNTGKVFVRLYRASPTSSLDLYSSAALCTNQWYHVSYVYDGSTARLYIDGNLDTVRTQNGNIGNSPQSEHIAIGANYYSGNYVSFFDGKVDELRIWNIARTSSQVRQNIYSPLALNDRTGLAGYYRFEGNYADSSGNGNHGSAVGNTTLSQETVYRPVLVTSPNTAVSWLAGSTEQITWTNNGLTAIDIEYSTDAGNGWISVATNVTASLGSYNWIVPSTPSTSCLVRISSSSCGSVTDVSDVFFTITDPPRFVDFGIFHSSGYDLEVRAKPNSDFFNTTMDSIKFTIRWLDSYNVSLGSISDSPYYIAKYGPEQVFGLYRYQIFKITIPQTIQWSSNTEHLLLRIAVNQTGTGTGTFELIMSSLTNAIGGSTTISLGGVDRTRSYYQAAASAVPLPVELLTFVAGRYGDRVYLNWTTATETNNNGFGIERSVGGSDNWATIGFVAGNGTTNESHSYFFSDDLAHVALMTNLISYRLRQVDVDGNSSYSHILDVNQSAPESLELVQNYPNPFKGSTSVQFRIPEEGFVTLVVFNSIGERVATLAEGNHSVGTHEVLFNSAQLPAGVYHCRLNWNGAVQTRQLVRVR